MSFEKQLMELYSSIKPGIVRQPWARPEQMYFPGKAVILALNLLEITRSALTGLWAAASSLLRTSRRKLPKI
jgi:hypothetical protein